MTTLTERLKGIENKCRAMKAQEYPMLLPPNPSLELAQELHALLVECGGFIEYADLMLTLEDDDMKEDKAAMKKLLTKLKQAGIV